jgi:hypothetical protein
MQLPPVPGVFPSYDLQGGAPIIYDVPVLHWFEIVPRMDPVRDHRKNTQEDETFDVLTQNNFEYPKESIRQRKLQL